MRLISGAGHDFLWPDRDSDHVVQIWSEPRSCFNLQLDVSFMVAGWPKWGFLTIGSGVIRTHPLTNTYLLYVCVCVCVCVCIAAGLACCRRHCVPAPPASAGDIGTCCDSRTMHTTQLPLSLSFSLFIYLFVELE